MMDLIHSFDHRLLARPARTLSERRLLLAEMAYPASVRDLSDPSACGCREVGEPQTDPHPFIKLIEVRTLGMHALTCWIEVRREAAAAGRDVAHIRCRQHSETLAQSTPTALGDVRTVDSGGRQGLCTHSTPAAFQDVRTFDSGGKLNRSQVRQPVASRSVRTLDTSLSCG